MPHCIIEHSSSIDSNALISLVFSASLESLLFEKDGSDIKVRALPFTQYQTGVLQSGADQLDFIHVTLKILSGRNTEQKKMLSNVVLSSLETLALKSCSISVEVVDIDRTTYAKVVT
ncbi:5-carboxymethyl-2-hydroxymuconate isomerase [Colwellia sp. 75C3]|uniref:5-carboxymethyl-2-hydroxymuconate Delta-isomerase n=1 Tax=Colwellia sp. 75C3 TaxID=888425 RepID=UPI000C33FA37|nr:5-carboxymethyl-2-hydroxymuconate Delta-isomerase [Colwellia sp. 75C3]PKG84299.1 5-carboxymethyl-2-hydroxymuconate isomerase [Colwellia sp. 75C3]